MHGHVRVCVCLRVSVRACVSQRVACAWWCTLVSDMVRSTGSDIWAASDGERRRERRSFCNAGTGPDFVAYGAPAAAAFPAGGQAQGTSQPQLGSFEGRVAVPAMAAQTNNGFPQMGVNQFSMAGMCDGLPLVVGNDGKGV